MEERTILLQGRALLADSLLNKGLAFSEAERDAFGLHGYLPRNIDTLDRQVDAAMAFLDGLATPFARHIRMRAIQDSNETLFYALLERDLEQYLPIVYTPTIGEACRKFSEIWHAPRGLFLSWPERDRIEEILSDPALNDVRVIVVTDGERVLGLGDQGVGGMGIPIGKLSLYTACAGIAPHQTLPITLDVGTNNEELLASSNYIGWKHKRVEGAEYDAFIEHFVRAVGKRWPNILLHWEDFAAKNAAPILERYRTEICAYNDDIQGTAAVTAGTILAANILSGAKISDHVIVLLGGGSAGVGIADLLLAMMIAEGTAEPEARSRFYMIDKDGLLEQNNPALSTGQRRFAREDWKGSRGADLAEVVRTVHPTVLVGACGVGGMFTEEIVRDMAAHCERPIVLPLSNPTSHAEATPRDLVAWTDGRVLVSTGSPFPPVKHDGRTRRVDMTNNSYIFPGVGLGVLACGATRITDGMIIAAAKGLAEVSPANNDPDGNLLPPLTDMREVAIAVAEATARQARAEGVCEAFEDGDLRRLIDRFVWTPQYQVYRKG
ncbi:NAD-dependent malic enzyme [Brytella acorum]|uniref:NAD-dependent malic enzyme n=1 Tax=Brytella acorum TaxID=2959299 RepID=UPI0025AE3D12|nr:NAD-dependent malic enzyme [Brytella acorum]MDF3623407.1 NAD-dependent malic enzyme [Brytella acorum]